MESKAKGHLRDFWIACGLPQAAWPEAIERYECFWGLIQQHNEQAGLMGQVSPDDFYLKHLADSLSILAAYPELIDEHRRLADVGCGAGLPGVVLAIALPGVQLAAIESNRKKTRFVTLAIQELNLANRAAAVNRRSRELGHDPAFVDKFNLVTARAVASADKLIQDCRLLLAPGGAAIFYKTPAAVAQEIPLARREAAKHNLALDMSGPIDLPAGAGTRQFIRVRKG